MTNLANPSPYLRTSRNFPSEIQPLTVEINKAYVDIANVVNSRSIGIFATIPTITGNTWYLRGGTQRNQTLRQIYSFTSTASIPHNIANVNPGQFINCFGSYTNGTNTYGLIYGTSVAIAGVIQFYITPTQIVFIIGAGAPALTSGNICLEWLSNS